MADSSDIEVRLSVVDAAEIYARIDKLHRLARLGLMTSIIVNGPVAILLAYAYLTR